MYLRVPLPLLTSTKSLGHQYWMANLSKCLKQQKAIKTCGGTPPHILNPITGWKCVVSFKTRSLDPWYLLNKELSYLGYNLVRRVKISTSDLKFSLLIGCGVGRRSHRVYNFTVSCFKVIKLCNFATKEKSPIQKFLDRFTSLQRAHNTQLNRHLSKFKVCKSVHHHTIQINQPTRCNNFSSLLLDVYIQLNMFRASSRPSSGAQQLQ